MLKCKNCSHVCMCTTVVHSTAQNSSDYLPFYSPVYWRGGANAGESPTLATAVSMGNNYATTASLKISPIRD